MVSRCGCWWDAGGMLWWWDGFYVDRMPWLGGLRLEGLLRFAHRRDPEFPIFGPRGSALVLRKTDQSHPDATEGAIGPGG